MLQIYRHTKKTQIITALILTGILSVGSGFTLINNANAAPIDFPTDTPNELIKQNTRANRLPRSVANAVLRDLSNRERISSVFLRITDYRQQTWRNGCLELQRPDELCTQALVPGWRVVVSRGRRQTWIYHTNQTGSVVRINEQRNGGNPTANLPPSIVEEVLADAANRARTKIAVTPRNITQAERVVWSNGCLDLGGGVCSFAQVPGWRVTVTIGREKFVYHTDNNFLVKFNRAASTTIGNVGTLQPIPIPESELPPPLDINVVFRSISSGGFAGRTYETVLLNDGRLIRVQIGNTNDSERSVRRLTRQQVQQFEQLLRRYGDEFNNLRYPVSRGSADYITYTLTSPEGTVEYNDIAQNQLPANLQAVITAWNQISDTQIPDDDNLNPVPIRPSELPLPLDQGVVFREISSGGFAGRTYETILRDDGLLIRVRIGDANDSERSVRRVSVQQVRQFQRLLERRAGEFQNISYPASRGAADFITYTLTSEEGTVQYNDISLNNLPQDLQGVLEAWRTIIDNAQ